MADQQLNIPPAADLGGGSKEATLAPAPAPVQPATASRTTSAHAPSNGSSVDYRARYESLLAEQRLARQQELEGTRGQMLRQVDPNYLQFAATELGKDKSLGELGVTFKTLQRNFPALLKKTTRTAPLPNEAPNGMPAQRMPEDIDLLPEVTAQNLSVNDKQRLYDMWQEMDENQRVTLRVAAKMMQDMQNRGERNPHQPPIDVMNNLKREIEAKQQMVNTPKRRR